MKTGKGQELWNRAKQIIPGGTQLLSKRSELFLPDRWPAYFKKAKGVEVWDLDGKHYVDMSIMAVGTCILGHADDDVNRAVKRVIDEGSMSTLNSPEEVELAELLLSLHPWAGMVRLGRSGGEAMAIAVRIGRAHSGKDKVAFCGYHGWHDWYLSANLADDKALDGHLLPGLKPLGVPRALKGTALPFKYNHIEELERIVAQNEIGVIVLETIRSQEPQNDFIGKVRAIADRTGAVLIFDEITCGFRMTVGGTYTLYQVEPDIVVYGKAISNGYPMALIIGRKEVMDAAQESFISSTYWTERIGPAASLATIAKMKKYDVPAHLCKIGAMIKNGWQEMADKHGLKISITGIMALPHFTFNDKSGLALQTLFTQELLKRGYLASKHVYVSYSHTEKHVADYLANVDEVFGIIEKALKENNVLEQLEGPVAQEGFKRLT
jgi:glutamate-1-semialdehyde aminotransferase